MSKFRGLCGVFNYRTQDDLTSIDDAVEKNIEAFASGYVVGPDCIVPPKSDACKSSISVKKIFLIKNLKLKRSLLILTVD